MEAAIMAKREKYADLVTRAAALDLRAHILEIATTDYPDALYRHRTGTDVYLWRAFRLPCAAGGYVVCICAPAGSTTNARHLGRGAFSTRARSSGRGPRRSADRGAQRKTRAET